MIHFRVLDNGSSLIGFEQPAPLLSMNDRHHWRKRAVMVAHWRKAAFVAARRIPSARRAHPLCTVEIEFSVKTRRRRDPHNLFPTVKAIVDGLVDGQVWPDDNDDFVKTIEPTVHVDGHEVGFVTIRLTPIPQKAATT